MKLLCVGMDIGFRVFSVFARKDEKEADLARRCTRWEHLFRGKSTNEVTVSALKSIVSLGLVGPGRHHGLNEPVRESWEAVKAYSEAIIKAVRKVDPDNILLAGSPHRDQDIHVAADNPRTGVSTIMYTLHFHAATHKQWHSVN